jgi:hypothetical protein
VEKVATRDSFLHDPPIKTAIAKLSAVYAAFREFEFTPVSFRGGR